MIALAGLVGAIWLRPGPPRAASRADDYPPGSLRTVLFALPHLAALPSVFALLFVFARIGVATFGDGIAMISPMEHEIVHVRGWLGEDAFRDAIVLGQITPGPIAISATFIGYQVAGLIGAALATFGMFAPPFFLAVVAARSMDAFRRSPVVSGFLAAVAPAVVGAIVAACVALFHNAVHGYRHAAIAAAVFALLVARPRLPPLLPIAASGALEVLLS